MNLTSVIITSSESFSLIWLINKVSVIIAISKTWRNDRSINLNPFLPHALFFMTIAVYKIKKESMFYLILLDMSEIRDTNIQ
mgnify:CR=1 FL=1